MLTSGCLAGSQRSHSVATIVSPRPSCRRVLTDSAASTHVSLECLVISLASRLLANVLYFLLVAEYFFPLRFFASKAVRVPFGVSIAQRVHALRSPCSMSWTTTHRTMCVSRMWPLTRFSACLSVRKCASLVFRSFSEQGWTTYEPSQPCCRPILGWAYGILFTIFRYALENYSGNSWGSTGKLRFCGWEVVDKATFV